MTTALDAVIRELESTRSALQRDLQRVEAALAALAARPTSDDPDAPPPVGHRRPSISGDNRTTEAPGARAEGAKGLLTALARSRPDAPVDVDVALEHLNSTGWVTTSGNPRNVVASTLAKMHREGILTKLRAGSYVYRDPVRDLDDAQAGRGRNAQELAQSA